MVAAAPLALAIDADAVGGHAEQSGDNIGDEPPVRRPVEPLADEHPDVGSRLVDHGFTVLRTTVPRQRSRLGDARGAAEPSARGIPATR
jgi:hypothetical protein